MCTESADWVNDFTSALSFKYVNIILTGGTAVSNLFHY